LRGAQRRSNPGNQNFRIASSLLFCCNVVIGKGMVVFIAEIRR